MAVNEARKRGRPRKLHREDALQAAVKVFWAKGFDGASINDLTEAMGVKAPSLYAEFGDKESLYRLAIDCYTSENACGPLVAFETESDIDKAVSAFLKAAITYATEHESGNRGCFLASCVATSAGEIEGVQEQLKKAIDETDRRLARRFEQAKADGLLPSNFPSLERARLMFDLRQGLVFRARAGCSPRTLKSDLAHRVRVILD